MYNIYVYINWIDGYVICQGRIPGDAKLAAKIQPLGQVKL